MDGGLGVALLLTGAAQGVATVGGLYASKQQAKLDRATIDYEASQAELAAADAAYQNTVGYRRALSQQIAMEGYRGGPGGSALRQFTMDTFANYAQDQAALARKAAQVPIARSIAVANASSNRLMRDLGLVGNLIGTAFNSYNFSSPSKSLGRAPGGASLSAGIGSTPGQRTRKMGGLF